MSLKVGIRSIEQSINAQQYYVIFYSVWMVRNNHFRMRANDRHDNYATLGHSTTYLRLLPQQQCFFFSHFTVCTPVAQCYTLFHWKVFFWACQNLFFTTQADVEVHTTPLCTNTQATLRLTIHTCTQRGASTQLTILACHLQGGMLCSVKTITAAVQTTWYCSMANELSTY